MQNSLAETGAQLLDTLIAKVSILYVYFFHLACSKPPCQSSVKSIFLFLLLFLRTCCLTQGHNNFSAMFSSRHFIVSDFMWKSITFGGIICKSRMDVWKFFFFSFLHVDIQLFLQHLLQRLFFLHYVAFALLLTIIHTCLGLFLDSILFYRSICIFFVHNTIVIFWIL